MGAGEVEAIEVPSSPASKFRVRLRVREDLHPLVRTDSVASIQTEGLVGGTFLFVNAGSDAAPRRAGRRHHPRAGAVRDGGPDAADERHGPHGERDDQGPARRRRERPLATWPTRRRRPTMLLTDVSDDVAAISEIGQAHHDRHARHHRRPAAGAGNRRPPAQRRRGLPARGRRPPGRRRAVVEEARKAVQQGREALEALQSKDGPTQGMAADLRETLGHARATLANMEENTQALKRNFFFRGLLQGSRLLRARRALARRVSRAACWRATTARRCGSGCARACCSPTRPDGTEELTADGRARVESAMAGFLRYAQDAPLVVEGYSTVGGTAQEYIQLAHARAAGARLPRRLTSASRRTARP